MPDHRSDPDWVLEALEDDQLVAAKQHFGLASIGKGTLSVLWALRLYLLVMLVLVARQVWLITHA